MPGSLRIGKIFGIDIYIHISWVVIIVLLTWSLAVGWFPVLYHGFSAITYWILGFIAAVLLFVSVLLHELAHSLVARARGLHSRRPIGLLHPHMRIGRIGRRLRSWKRLQLARQGQGLRDLDDLNGFGRIGLQHGLPWRVVVLDFRGLPGSRAGGERDRGEQGGRKQLNTHQPSSLDQLKAWT